MKTLEEVEEALGVIIRNPPRKEVHGKSGQIALFSMQSVLEWVSGFGGDDFASLVDGLKRVEAKRGGGNVGYRV